MTPALENRIADAIHDALDQLPDLKDDVNGLVIAVAYSIGAEPEDVRKVHAKRFAVGEPC